MHLEKIFYGFGLIFAIATILYFTWEYIINFPDIVKSIILICVSIVLFFVGGVMRSKEI